MYIKCEVVKQDCSKLDYVNGCGYNHQYVEKEIIDTDALDIVGAVRVKDPVSGVYQYLCHWKNNPHRYPVILDEKTWKKVMEIVTKDVVEI